MPGFANAEVTFWWVAIGIGFVVVLVAAALLQLLISLVKDIDRGVDSVKATLAATAGNTANSPLIGAVAHGVDDILMEGLNHHLFLTRELVAAEAWGRHLPSSEASPAGRGYGR